MVAFRQRGFSFTETSQITDLRRFGNTRVIEPSAHIHRNDSLRHANADDIRNESNRSVAVDLSSFAPSCLRAA